MLRKLYPTFNNPNKWRTPLQRIRFPRKNWKRIRKKILERDIFTCVFCKFKADKYMYVHHINDDPNDNRQSNLETICVMCNLILHAGQGVVIQQVVDLYKYSKYSQIDVIRKTRELRTQGKKDEEIIHILNLKEKMEFKQDKAYLQKLVGFISSRRATQQATQNALEYMYQVHKNILKELRHEHKLLSAFPRLSKLQNKKENITWIVLQAIHDLNCGKEKVALFLKGSKSHLVKEKNLHTKQGYGALFWHTIPIIKSFIMQLKEQRYISEYRVQSDEYSYPILRLTEIGKKALENKEQIKLNITREEKPISLGETEKKTLYLFKQGLRVDQIAKRRALAVSTIFSHIHKLISTGHISAKNCVSDVSISRILNARNTFSSTPRLRELKEILPENITYEEIRAVLADKRLV